MSIASRFQRLKNDLKPMTFREKVDHIWTYYKELFFTVAVVLALVVGLLISAFSPKKETLVAGVACNVGINTSGQQYLTETFEQTHDHKTTEHAFLNYMEYGDPNTVNEIGGSFDAVMGLLAMAEGKTVDYMLLDETSLQAFGSEQIFMDLREIFTEEELRQFEKELIQMKYQSDGTVSQDKLPQDAPRAVNIGALPFAKECLGAKDGSPVYLVFLETTPREPACRMLWEHIRNWNK